MTPDLHALMTAWLASEHEHERKHAAIRLSLPDAIGYTPEMGTVAPAPPPLPAPFVVPPAFRRGWKNCLYASHSQTGCCGGALTCHRLGEVIPLARCVQCLEVDTR